MHDFTQHTKNEEGFVLILSLLILVVLTIIGITATSTTTLELQIAGNDKIAGETFHKADGAIEAGIEILEQNIVCPSGFSAAPAGFDSGDPDTSFSIAGIDIYDNLFYLDVIKDDVAGAAATQSLYALPSDTVRSVRIPDNPSNRTDTAPHTNIAAFGATRFIAGNAIQMAAGYEGRGKGLAGGGGEIVYEVHAQHTGRTNSATTLAIEWRHIITGLVGCQY